MRDNTNLTANENNSGRVASYKENLVGKKKKTSMKIMIKEKDGNYGDWTGSFNLKRGETLEDLRERVKEHFRNYFNTQEYADKNFALVIVDKGVRRIEPNFSL